MNKNSKDFIVSVVEINANSQQAAEQINNNLMDGYKIDRCDSLPNKLIYIFSRESI